LIQSDISPENILAQIKAGDRTYDLVEHNLIWRLLSALNNGFRLEAITELIESPDPAVSSTGVYILEELSVSRVRERVHVLRETALKLSRSPDGWRRKVFVEFCKNARFDDDEVLENILERLSDIDLNVRCWAMDWVLKARNVTVLRMASLVFGKQIASHKDLVEQLTSIDPFDRKLRGFKIAVMTKSGIPVEEVLNRVGFEDSFTYQMLTHNETNHSKRWQKMPRWTVS